MTFVTYSISNEGERLLDPPGKSKVAQRSAATRSPVAPIPNPTETAARPAPDVPEVELEPGAELEVVALLEAFVVTLEC